MIHVSPAALSLNLRVLETLNRMIMMISFLKQVSTRFERCQSPFICKKHKFVHISMYVCMYVCMYVNELNSET
jgi:hypothetical protein